MCVCVCDGVNVTQHTQHLTSRQLYWRNVWFTSVCPFLSFSLFCFLYILLFCCLTSRLLSDFLVLFFYLFVVLQFFFLCLHVFPFFSFNVCLLVFFFLSLFLSVCLPIYPKPSSWNLEYWLFTMNHIYYECREYQVWADNKSILGPAGAVVSTVASEQEGSGFKPRHTWGFSVQAWSPCACVGSLCMTMISGERECFYWALFVALWCTTPHTQWQLGLVQAAATLKRWTV